MKTICSVAIFGMILLPPELKDTTAEHLAKMRFIQKVDITDESEKWGLLWVIGPEALARSGDALGVHGDMLAAVNKILIPPDRASWHLWRHERWSVPAITLLLPQTEVAEALDLMQASGAVAVAKAAADIVRLEREIPECGLEIDSNRILLEANLTDTFSRSKGCYPGQEVVERISAYGEGKTPFKLKILWLKGKRDLEIGAELVHGDDKAGTVVRSLYDPLKDATLVAAYVATKYLDQLGAVTVKE